MWILKILKESGWSVKVSQYCFVHTAQSFSSYLPRSLSFFVWLSLNPFKPSLRNRAKQTVWRATSCCVLKIPVMWQCQLKLVHEAGMGREYGGTADRADVNVAPTPHFDCVKCQLSHCGVRAPRALCNITDTHLHTHRHTFTHTHALTHSDTWGFIHIMVPFILAQIIFSTLII